MDILGYVHILPSYKSYLHNREEYLYCIDNLYGNFEFYKNKNGYYQLKTFNVLMILSEDLKYSLVLYKGNMVYGGKVVNVSKKEIEYKISKTQKYIEIQKEINQLKEEQRKIKLKGVLHNE